MHSLIYSFVSLAPSDGRIFYTEKFNQLMKQFEPDMKKHDAFDLQYKSEYIFYANIKYFFFIEFILAQYRKMFT